MMYFEDNKLKVYTSEDIDLLSALEIEDLNLHVYEDDEKGYFFENN